MLPKEQILDGVSLVPLFSGEELVRDDPLCVFVDIQQRDLEARVGKNNPEGKADVAQSANDQDVVAAVDADAGAELARGARRRPVGLALGA